MSIKDNNESGYSRSFGCEYGEYNTRYGGYVINVCSLPDGTYFHVANGYWDGYVTSDKNGNRVVCIGITTSVDPVNNCTNKLTFPKDAAYDCCVSNMVDEKGNEVIVPAMRCTHEVRVSGLTLKKLSQITGMDICDGKSIALFLEKLVVDAEKFAPPSEEKKYLDTASDITNRVYDDYQQEATELNGLFFDFDVRMPKRDLLQIYADIVEAINGDNVVRLEGVDTFVHGETIRGRLLPLIPEGEYEDTYEGNYKDFLESFNDRESETGLFRVMDYESVDNDDTQVIGLKLDFIW